MADIRLVNVAKSYQGLSHQTAALNWLQERIPSLVLAEFAELWRADPPAKPQASPSPGQPDKVMLKVPYEYQLDNRSGAGQRECFSSSCAMVARYYGRVAGDDDYNAIRARFGDTTNSGAQLRALGSLGLQATFHQNGDAATLERLIRDGCPVPVGWLHRGSISHPTGGGHWSVVIGFDDQAFIHNDPNGEADMVGGGYVSNSNRAGAGVRYSRRNWLRRWEVDGKGTGWYLRIKP